jgi:surfeit locus 1 family protein
MELLYNLLYFSLDRLPELEYYPVRVRGKFDHSREILIEPRSRLDSSAHENRAGSRQAPASQSGGAHVITPFRVANRK